MRRLRTYQLEAVRQMKQILDSGQDPLLLAPTGSGKTAMCSKLVKDLCRRSRAKVLMVVPRTSLVTQSIKELEGWGLDVGAIAGGLREARRAQVQVATYQAIGTRGIDWLQPDYTILDEVHLSAFPKVIKDWVPNITNFWQSKNRLIGLTATPRRLDKHTSLGELFLPNNIVFAPPIAELIRLGHLVRPMYAICPNAVTKKMVFDPDYVVQIYAMCDRRPTIVFVPSVAKANLMVLKFLEAGVEAIAVTGGTRDRDAIFARFNREDLPVLVSCQVLREGVDLPPASNLIMAVDPDSHSSYVQIMGRFARPHRYLDGTKKTHFTVYDLTGAVDRHGRIEELVYTADDIELLDTDPGEIPTKPCVRDDCDIRSLISAIVCKCGCEFDIRKQRTETPQGIPFALLSKSERTHKAVYEQLLIDAFDRGDRPRVARDRFYSEYGYTPPILWRRSFSAMPAIAQWLRLDGAKIQGDGSVQLALELDG